MTESRLPRLTLRTQAKGTTYLTDQRSRLDPALLEDQGYVCCGVWSLRFVVDCHPPFRDGAIIGWIGEISNRCRIFFIHLFLPQGECYYERARESYGMAVQEEAKVAAHAGA